MSNTEKDCNNNLGAYIDVAIGKDSKKNSDNFAQTKYFEEEMLLMFRKQTEYLRQIMRIANYFFYLSILLILIAIIYILIS
jgi:hypothetical protein